MIAEDDETQMVGVPQDIPKVQLSVLGNPIQPFMEAQLGYNPVLGGGFQLAGPGLKEGQELRTITVPSDLADSVAMKVFGVGPGQTVTRKVTTDRDKRIVEQIPTTQAALALIQQGTQGIDFLRNIGITKRGALYYTQNGNAVDSKKGRSELASITRVSSRRLQGVQTKAAIRFAQQWNRAVRLARGLAKASTMTQADVDRRATARERANLPYQKAVRTLRAFVNKYPTVNTMKEKIELKQKNLRTFASDLSKKTNAQNQYLMDQASHLIRQGDGYQFTKAGGGTAFMPMSRILQQQPGQLETLFQQGAITGRQMQEAQDILRRRELIRPQ